MRFEWELPSADRLVVGTVGPPGQRAFFLQAREGAQLVTLKLEKIHVAELSHRLLELIEDWPELDTSEIEGGELEEPVEADFVVGSLALAFHDDGERIIIVAEELVAEDEEEDEEEGSVARIVVSRAQIAALARHGAELVTAGRAPCPLCGYPLDPRGHVCPRSNGHGPPRT